VVNALLTWFIIGDRRIALVESKHTARQTVTFVFGKPRVALEEVMLALGRHVNFDILDKPSAPLRDAIVSHLKYVHVNRSIYVKQSST